MITYPYPGGKANAIKYIFPHIPQNGYKFIDVFGGRGNIFFNVVTNFNYQFYEIHDLIQYPWYNAIKDLDNIVLPTVADYDPELIYCMLHPLARNTNNMALLFEPYLTRFGAGYHKGPHISDKRPTIHYSPEGLRQKYHLASRILNMPNVKFSGTDYRYLDYSSNSTFYFDPPYVGIDNLYKSPTFNHKDFLHFVQELLIKVPSSTVIISNYNNDAYLSEFGEPTVTWEKKIDVDFSAKTKLTMKDCLWVMESSCEEPIK